MLPSRLSFATAGSSSSREQTTAASSSRFRGREAEMYTSFTKVENRHRQGKISDRDDSWIEISSQPSDDTYSSASGYEDGGLTMHGHRGPRRKRKTKRTEIPLSGRGTAAGTSSSGSNKSYDHSADDLSETEVIDVTSSGPGSSIGELPTQEDFDSSSSGAEEKDDGSSEDEEEGVAESDDGEDTGTMLGVGRRNSTRDERLKSPSISGTTPTAAANSSATTSAYRIPVSRINQQHSSNSVHEFQRSIQSPSQSFLRHRNSTGSSGRYIRSTPAPATKADHDEALMASLSTLLSCAAAARGLPKVSQQGSGSGGPSRVPTMSSSRVQLDTLQLVPGQVMEEKEKVASPISDTAPASDVSTSPLKAGQEQRFSRQDASVGGQRKSTSASSSRDHSKKRTNPIIGAGQEQSRSSSASEKNYTRRRSASPRATSKSNYKKLTSALSSTDASLLTLALSAGAVILLSAISFSAGYAMGKEVGKAEAEAVVGAVVGRGGGVVREAQRGGRGLVVGSVGRVVSVGA